MPKDSIGPTSFSCWPVNPTFRVFRAMPSPRPAIQNIQNIQNIYNIQASKGKKERAMGASTASKGESQAEKRKANKHRRK